MSDDERSEWLTVKEFAVRAGMRESSVRDAIRDGRLAFKVTRITRGPKGSIRIIVPRTFHVETQI